MRSKGSSAQARVASRTRKSKRSIWGAFRTGRGETLEVRRGLGCEAPPVFTRLCIALFLCSSVAAEPARFPGFGGASKPLPLKAGQKAWVPYPLSSSFSSCSVSLRSYVGVSGKDPVFKFVGSEMYRIPSPLVRLKSAARVVPGSPVLAGHRANSSYGLVSSVAGDKATVRTFFIDRVETEKVPLDEVLALDGTLAFGAPVAYKVGQEWQGGQMLHKGPKTSWLLDWMKKPVEVPTSTVVPLKLKKWKAGEKVSARSGGAFAPATVVAALDGGLRYTVRMDAYPGEQKVDFVQVAPRLK
jgi:hypothetical protein